VRFSIAVPTRNRPAQLAALLEALAELDYPREEFEVIVVDDGSEPPVASSLRVPPGLTTRLLRCDHGGPARARQTGIAVAQGRYLAFTDDDCRPASNWLRALEKALEAHPGCAVGGRTVNALPDNPFAETSQRLISSLYDAFRRQPRQLSFFTTNNVGLPASAYRAVGGLDVAWDTCGGEDRDLFARWQQHGYGMVYEPRMVVHHAHDLSWQGFMLQHFHYGRGAFRFRARHARNSAGRPTLAPLAFYLRLVALPLGPPVPRHAARIALLLVLSQLCHTVGYVSEGMRRSHTSWQRVAKAPGHAAAPSPPIRTDP